MKYPIVSSDPDVQARYEESRRAGQSHAFAEICAFRAPPGLKTDTRFVSRREPDKSIVGNRSIRDYYYSKARGAGVVPDSCFYVDGLADFPGDPNAWCQSKSELKKKCEAKGVGCVIGGDEIVKTPVTPDVKKKYEVNPRVVAEETVKELRNAGEDPARLSKKELADVTEKVKHRITPLELTEC